MFYYKIVATGEVLGASHNKPQDAEWIGRYKAALNITDEVVAFESETDPRPPNPRKEAPPAPGVTPADTVLTALNAATTLAQIKSALVTYYESKRQ